MADRAKRPDYKSDPTRCCLKLPAWPVSDQAAWEAAITKRGLLEEGGAASHWTPKTRKSVLDAYGRWLTFLGAKGWLEPDVPLAERLTPDRLRAFLVELDDSVESFTRRNRVRDLAEALRVMAPGVDVSYLRAARNNLKKRAEPVRNKRAQMVPIQDLFCLGRELTERADRGECARPLWNAALYRDGLAIMMLACRPIRRESFAGLRLGQHLVKRGDVYVILLDGTETKNHRSYEQPLPSALTPFIERYLEHYRPQQLAGSPCDYLWISWRGVPLADTGVYAVIKNRTEAAFGIAITPHLFRDCAVTSMGETDPELVWLAPALLHHADPRIAEMHYDQARDTQAVKVWQEHVQTQRRAAKKKRKERIRRDRSQRKQRR